MLAKWLLKSQLLLLVASSASAGRLSVEKAEAFFNKEKPCVLAIAPIYPKKDTQNRVTDLTQKLTHASDAEIVVPAGSADSDVDVICVFDGAKYAGTINEISGCFAGYFNPATGNWKGILNENSRQTIGVEGKKCTKEVVQELLKPGKLANDFKKTDDGRTLKSRLGNYNSFFELYLRIADRVLHPDLRVLYDKHDLISSLCLKSPCGQTIFLQEQLAAIKPDAEDLADQKKSNFFERIGKLITETDLKVVNKENKENFSVNLSGFLGLQIAVKSFCQGPKKLSVCAQPPPWYKPINDMFIGEERQTLIKSSIENSLYPDSARYCRQAAQAILGAALDTDPGLNLDRLFEENQQIISSEKTAVIETIKTRKRHANSAKKAKEDLWK